MYAPSQFTPGQTLFLVIFLIFVLVCIIIEKRKKDN